MPLDDDEMERDPGFHEHAIRSAIMDYYERFGHAQTMRVLNIAIKDYHMEVVSVRNIKSAA